MFKSILLVLVAVSCQAATVTYHDQVANGTSTENIETTFDGGVAFDDNFDWTIQDLDLSDIGTTFTLDATTAASYGITMQQLEDAFNSLPMIQGPHWFKPFLKTTSGDHILGDTGVATLLAPYAVASFEIEQVQFRFRDVGNGSQILAEAWITLVVPEPSSLLLCFVLLIVKTLHRQRVGT